MKLTMKRVVFVSFLVFLSCVICGCQLKNNLSSEQMVEVADDTANSSLSNKKENAEESHENTVISMAVGESEIVRNYVLYIMNAGEVSCTKEVQKSIEGNANLNDIYKELLEELTTYIGYDVMMNSVTVGADQVKIDLNKTSDIFHKSEYNAAIVQPVKYSNYDNMAFGILDSMSKTIQENQGRDIEVVYTEDGNAMELPELSMEVEFPLEEAYQGSQYYKDIYLSRPEGSIADFVELGMTYNEVLVQLNENEIETIQSEEFSMLGDHTSWENYNNVDEYLRNAWVHIKLTSDDYEFIFDGQDTTLMEISVIGREIGSSRGLCVGDGFKHLLELYGDSYTMYVIEGSLLYEYRLEDCYFRVFVDEAQETVLSYGIATYSQSEIIQGEQILDEIKYQQDWNKVLEEEDNLGL